MMNKLSDEGRTTSLGLLTYSKKYFNAYEILKDEGSFSDYSPVLLYLFCHGIELCFKAFLKSEKCSVKDLKYVGHDLGKLCKRCQEMGLSEYNILTKQDFNSIALLNCYYKEKEFEYIYSGSKQYPKDLAATLNNIKTFIRQIERKCSESSRSERKVVRLPSPSGRGPSRKK